MFKNEELGIQVSQKAINLHKIVGERVGELLETNEFKEFIKSFCAGEITPTMYMAQMDSWFSRDIENHLGGESLHMMTKVNLLLVIGKMMYEPAEKFIKAMVGIDSDDNKNEDINVSSNFSGGAH